MTDSNVDVRDSDSTVRIVCPFRERSWMIEVQDHRGAQRVPLAGERVVVGSSTEHAHVVVSDLTVSAVHCELCPTDDAVVVRDRQSKNGTFVGGARVREAWATNGATITVGRSIIVLSEDDGEEPVDEALDKPLPLVAGSSIAMRRVAARVRRFARYSQPVLIRGETGTGKELIARALHTEGPRADKPFVVLNVAAIPRELLESELFGHERGAFTGAVSRRAGAFAEADGGTLFLDEIGDLPIEAQPKLLRALDGYEVRRVGSSGSGKALDVRLVTASHVPLEQRVEEGRFRRDLFHRLGVRVIAVPPLRERRGDLAAIAVRLLEQEMHEIGHQQLTTAAVGFLAGHTWPGNVRELRNTLVQAADVAVNAGVIDAADLERAMRARTSSNPPAPASFPLREAQLTPALAKAILVQHDNNLSAAARAAGCSRTSFRKLVRA